MKNFESIETYLETILMLSKTNNAVRSVDIANKLDYSRPSISVAMKNLREKGLIVMDQNNNIELTQSGKKIAESMYERHMFITSWLVKLGVDQETAVTDACRMEHAMSEQSFSAIKKHIESIMAQS